MEIFARPRDQPDLRFARQTLPWVSAALKRLGWDGHLWDYCYLPWVVYRRLFEDGWGGESLLTDLALPQLQPLAQIPRLDPEFVGREEFTAGIASTYCCGSPVTNLALPAPVQQCSFTLVQPRSGASSQPVCLLLPATGDASIAYRLRFIALPLLQAGVSTLILQSPYYGDRRPQQQKGTQLRTVRDLMQLGIATIEEARSLLVWLQQQQLGPLGIAGISRGGLLAAITAAVTPLPLATVPFIPSHSGGATFADGFLHLSCAWRALGSQMRAVCRSQCKERLFHILARTDIRNFPRPQRPDAAICVAAARDRLVSPTSGKIIHRYWPGSEIRTIAGGHVSAILLRTSALRTAILDSFTKL